MGLDTDYLNADPLYLRARQLGNRHDRAPFEITGGTGWHPMVKVAICVGLVTGCVIGIFFSKL